MTAESPTRCNKPEFSVIKNPQKSRWTFSDCLAYPVQAWPVFGSAVVTVQGVEPLPERRLIDGGMQHLQRQRVAPGVLSVVELRRRGSPSAHGRSVALLVRAGAHLRTPHPPAVVERRVNAVSRHQRAVLGLPRVGVEAGRAHPVSGRVA